MQTLEAMISFFVFVVFTTYVLAQLEDYNGIDDSLYRYQLANDVWRVLYLQGDFRDLSVLSALDEDLETVSDKTGFCIYVMGQQGTPTWMRGADCRVDEEPLAQVHHVVIVNGVPTQVPLSLYQSE